MKTAHKIFLLQSNALYIPLADESISMVVTSPPYFGLRDYGTAKWDGGRADCDHRHQLGGEGEKSAKQNTSAGMQRVQYKDFCRLCGAVRIDNQIGLEATPEEFISAMVAVFREVWRVLHPSGVVFLNLGDTYSGSWGNMGKRPELDNDAGGQREKNSEYFDRRGYSEYRDRPASSFKHPVYKPKDLMMIPARVALALQADGWWLRSDIIWAKPNPMPESVTDRPTKSHEHIFLLTKSARCFYDHEAVKEKSAASDASKGRMKYGRYDAGKNAGTNGERSGKPDFATSGGDFESGSRNRRDVWTITTRGYPGSHFATFPPELPRICIKAGSSEKGNCPDCGSPWERMVEKVFIPQPDSSRGRNHISGGDQTVSGTGWEGSPRGINETKTIGWKPTCKCYYPDFSEWKTVPAVILDPFGGAATTALVARELGRNSVMLDLSAEYIELQKERLGITALKEWGEGKPATAADRGPWFGREE